MKSLGLLLAFLIVCGVAEARTPPLALRTMGVFYVGGARVDSPYSDERDSQFPTSGRSTVSGQSKVTFLIPARVTGASIVLVPGYGLSSAIYLSTPDGREGWAQFFARHGHPTYVVDAPDRSSAGFSVDAVNGCIAADPAFPCSAAIRLGKTSLEQPWSVWGFGPRFGERYVDSRFPALPLQQHYIEQFGASFEVFIGAGTIGRPQAGAAGAGAPPTAALTALLARVGPSVLVLHSAAGATGFAVARQSPELVRAIVSVETTACPALQDGATDPIAGIPFLGFYGDYVSKRSAGGHQGRYASCKALAESTARRAVGRFIDLPGDLEIRGNSHLMMQDDNNHRIAGMVRDWLSHARVVRQ